MSTRFMRFGITIAAVAALSAGTAYALLSLRARAANSSADVELSAHQLSKDSDVRELLDWISVRAMPELDQGNAVPERAARNLELTTPTIISVGPPASDCGRWRSLTMGPVGRKVANICRGLQLSPPNSLEPQILPKLTLPSIGDFNSVFAGQTLASNHDSPQAAGASQQVLRSLRNRFTQAIAPAPRALPFVDPLGWSVVPQFSPSTDQHHQLHRG